VEKRTHGIIDWISEYLQGKPVILSKKIIRGMQMIRKYGRVHPDFYLLFI